MGKKLKNKKNNKLIFLVLLILVIVASIFIIAFIKNNNKENAKNNVNIDGLENFIEKNVNDTDFLALVSSKLDTNAKVDYIIFKLMKNNNKSSISIDEVEKEYINEFGDDINNPIMNYLHLNDLDYYELNRETNEYTLKEDSDDILNIENKAKMEFANTKIKNNQIVSTFKVYTPKKTSDFIEYFSNKTHESIEESDKIHSIILKVMEIENKAELSNEDKDYLLKIMEEDLDKLANVSEFEVVFEKLDDRFIIKDVKLI